MIDICNRLAAIPANNVQQQVEEVKSTSALQAFALTNQNQKNGSGPAQGQKQEQRKRAASSLGKWCVKKGCTNDPQHLFEECTKGPPYHSKLWEKMGIKPKRPKFGRKGEDKKQSRPSNTTGKHEKFAKGLTSLMFEAFSNNGDFGNVEKGDEQ